MFPCFELPTYNGEVSEEQHLYWDSELELGDDTEALSRLAWPRFVVEDGDIPDPTLTFEVDREQLRKRFPVWGLRRDEDDRLVAFMNGVLISSDPALQELPADGWRYALREFAALRERPNCLCLLNASVDPALRKLGLSQHLLEAAKEVAAHFDLKFMIGPVRPTKKAEFPLESIEEFLMRRNKHGEIFDPWLRQHARCGAEVLNVCKDSVVVRATLGKWREWTGMPFDTDGDLIVPGALMPVKVNLKEGIAEYREPNIWVRYRL